MKSYQRTHTCGALRHSNIGKQITLCGWVHRRRDHGGLIFIDLRDRFGITQIIFDPKKFEQIHRAAEDLRSEWVIGIEGRVIARAEGMANKNMPTGDIEIEASSLEVFSRAETPPFSICDETIDVNEELRLKYRFLDMRRGYISKMLTLRHDITHEIRSFLKNHTFIDIATPILCKSTPEGARDFLVPSRIHPGHFYALPQSPQLFKQLLMLGGMDRYYQIAPCFRDEDLRSDRQPEFTQIDIEMSFSNSDELMTLMESLFSDLFNNFLKLKIKTPFQRMKHADAVEKYGTDRPDLRFGMTLCRLDDQIKKSDFTVLIDALNNEGCVKAITIKNGAEFSRRKIDRYIEFVGQFGLKGLAWIKRQNNTFASSIVKFFSDELLSEIAQLTDLQEGDLLLIGAGPDTQVNQALDHLRRHIAEENQLIPSNHYSCLWITDFPMFNYDAQEKRYKAEHHPFSMPMEEDLDFLKSEPIKTRSVAYDLVINGLEIGGGSQRIHCAELQQQIFEVLGLSAQEIESKFGFFLNALRYGAPPHLGIAFGLDRLVMLFGQTQNIRDVIAFPKTQKASDLMIEAPSKVHREQLEDLNIKAML